MKNKLGFLDFSNTKEKNDDNKPLDIDLIIKELLDFGNETARKQFKSVKYKKKKGSAQSDNDISVPVTNNSKDNNISSRQSTSDVKTGTKPKEPTINQKEHETKRVVRHVHIYLLKRYQSLKFKLHPSVC